MHFCCIYGGDVGIYDELIRAGFDDTTKTADGRTPLDLAKENEKTDLAEHIELCIRGMISLVGNLLY